MESHERRKKRSAPVKINKDIYFTAAQKADRNKVYDECERFCNSKALKWFREQPYQLVYLAKLRQAEQDHKSAADAAGKRQKTQTKKMRGECNIYGRNNKEITGE